MEASIYITQELEASIHITQEMEASIHLTQEMEASIHITQKFSLGLLFRHNTKVDGGFYNIELEAFLV